MALPFSNEDTSDKSHKRLVSKMFNNKGVPDSMTNSRKLDPRVERTQEALSAALMALIEEKGYDAISVQDITERSRLNRATFYLHYKDKQDLLIRTSEAAFDRSDCGSRAD